MIVKVLPELTLNTRLTLLPLIVKALAAAVGALIVRFLSMTNSPLVSVIVCGVANTPAVSNVIVAPLQAVAIASRNEQSPSHTPSLVSAILVTTGLLPHAITFWFRVLLVFGSKFPSPLYVAVIG